MEQPKASVALFQKLRQFGFSGLIVLGVTTLIIYDISLTQIEKSDKAELIKNTLSKESTHLSKN
jgi:hypothetical protein